MNNAQSLYTALDIHEIPSVTIKYNSMAEYLSAVNPERHQSWAWGNYRSTVIGLAAGLDLNRVCEIGGGRDPLFTAEETARFGFSFTVNDMVQSELDAGPAGLDLACFDIAGDVTPFLRQGGAYDLMVSRMVFEHVKDVRAAWSNIHDLLSMGGVGVAFIPTLYAWPYVINRLIPEELSSRIVHALYPNRGSVAGDPKFPALYDWAFGSQARLEPMLKSVGFSEVEVVPFWSHSYLKGVPILEGLDAAFNRLAERRDWRAMTTYAYVMARK